MAYSGILRKVCVNINKLIENDKCLVLKSRTKTEALHEIIDLVELSGDVSDIENLKKEIFYREQIMSTGIGQGIAIPHVRFEGVKEPVVYLAICSEGLIDYESIDDEKVQIIAMILVGANQHKEYLRILSLMVKKLKDKSLQSQILKAENNDTIANIIKGEL